MVKGWPTGIAIESIAIPLFESTSTERGFEAAFTEVIRNEFMGRSKVPIVDREKAGAVITGRIYAVETEPMSYNTSRQSVGGNRVSYETGGTRKLSVKVSVSLTDSATGKVLWHDNSMEEDANFRVSGDPLKNRYNEEQAIRSIAGLIAKRIYLNTMERF